MNNQEEECDTLLDRLAAYGCVIRGDHDTDEAQVASAFEMPVAARLVACWNACHGIPSEDLERIIQAGQAASRKFTLWLEGHNNQLEHTFSQASFIGEVFGPDFRRAVRDYVESMADTNPIKASWKFDEVLQCWRYRDKRAYDNEFDARLAFG